LENFNTLRGKQHKRKLFWHTFTARLTGVRQFSFSQHEAQENWIFFLLNMLNMIKLVIEALASVPDIFGEKNSVRRSTLW
jgi:hypothetical protein